MSTHSALDVTRSLCATFTAARTPLRCAACGPLAAMTSGAEGSEDAAACLRVWDLSSLESAPLQLSLTNSIDVPHLALATTGKPETSDEAIVFAACSNKLRAWRLRRGRSAPPQPIGAPAELQLASGKVRTLHLGAAPVRRRLGRPDE